MKTVVKDLGKVSITPKDEWDIRKPYERLDLVREITTGKIYISKKDVPIGIDIEDTEYWTKLLGDISKLEIVWDNDSNMNNIITSGTYNVFGKHTNINDNLPIEDIIIEDTFAANLLVLNSSINSNSSNSDESVTQILSLDCRHKKGEIYIRTGKGSSLDNLTWENWSTLQRNVNVGEVGSLDDLKENGIYSGVWKQGRINPNYLAFVCFVINDYIIGIAPRRVSQFVYGLSKSDGSVVYQSRVWDDSKGMWGDWEILNHKEIASMIKSSVDNAIKGIIADAPEAFDTLKEIANWIDEHGSVVTAIYTTIQQLSKESVKFDTFEVEELGDGIGINYATFNGNGGSIEISFATTEKAGVMSAADKKKLDSLSPGGGGSGGDITATPTEKVIEEIEPTLVSTAIRKTPQVLTDSEKEITRENIGAVGFSDLNNAIAEAITNTLNTAV